MFRTSEYERHKERNPDPVEGTCQWFLRHPNYTNWRNSGNSSIIWVSADPGCGKSVLSKLLADNELRATRSRTTCYFFFKDDNDDQKTATSALCALLHQVFTQKPELLEHAVKIFDQNGQSLKTSVDLLWQVLTTAAQDPRAGEIVCILDALDECRLSELKLLLRKLCSFYDERSRTSTDVALKFLVTSRLLQHIEDEFRDLSQKIPAIRLAGEEHTDEILYETGLVIESEIEKIQRDFPMNPKTVRILRDEFTKVEHRTYLWLMLIFDLIRQDLQTVMTATEREKIFHAIPNSVDAAYTAILNKSNNKGRARMLLKIVCVAIRPLSVMEITTALLIQESYKTYDDLEIPPGGFSKTYIRNLCGLFVSVIDGKVFLLHQTAKEFLMRKEDYNQHSQPAFSLPRDEIWKDSVSMQDSNLFLASACMWFLRLEEFMNSSVEYEDIDQLIAKYEFFEYSATNWAIHFRAAVVLDGDPLLNLSFELSSVQENRHMSWKLILWRSNTRYRRVRPFHHLHLALYLGLEKVAGQLLAAPGVDVNAVDEEGDTPLYSATNGGYRPVVDLLLAIPGINVNASGNSMTPLSLAVIRRFKELIDLFLSIPETKVNVLDNARSSPLSKAVHYGDETLVCQLLATPGVDVNFPRPHTPLVVAAEEGRQGIVALLLATPGIEVNGDHKNNTPLIGAVLRGHGEVVGQLLAAPGIDINVTNSLGSTALSEAATKGFEAIVCQLLAAGANINTVDNTGQTPLHRAVMWGGEAVVTQLLAVSGIDVNTRREYHNNTAICEAATRGEAGMVRRLLAVPGVVINGDKGPLWWAAYHGREVVVDQLLAVHSIDVNAVDDGYGRSPLLCAALEGHEVVVGQLLAAPTINVNTADKDGKTPLLCAALKGHEVIVRQLLAAPTVNVNIADNNHETPLSSAAHHGHEATVALLLATPSINVNGAGVNENSQSPLWHAAYSGHVTIIGQLLAAPCINVNTIQHGTTPLQIAAQMGHQDAVRQLLTVPNIDINAAKHNGVTPLSIAQDGGYEGIVKLLQSRAIVVGENPEEDSA